MTLREETIADAQAAWFDTDGLAQTVLYRTEREGAAMGIPAVMLPGENLKDDGRYLVEEMEILVRQADVAAPQDGHLLTIGGIEWTVRRVKGGDALGIAWRLECTKGVRATRRGP